MCVCFGRWMTAWDLQKNLPKTLLSLLYPLCGLGIYETGRIRVAKLVLKHLLLKSMSSSGNLFCNFMSTWSWCLALTFWFTLLLHIKGRYYSYLPYGLFRRYNEWHNWWTWSAKQNARHLQRAQICVDIIRLNPWYPTENTTHRKYSINVNEWLVNN